MAALSRNSDQIALRIPNGLRDRIKASADTNRRSMNSEIVVILERALEGRGGVARSNAGEGADVSTR